MTPEQASSKELFEFSRGILVALAHEYLVKQNWSRLHEIAKELHEMGVEWDR